ncbi:hypothetical protein [Microbulbifer sp. SAOS-129_SWC]|uniref:hypothetical protein n=1 Tax=Microbulbifer sp. SAOS-129_SWC TaxID=3145235 RepID=UPI003216CF22
MDDAFMITHKILSLGKDRHGFRWCAMEIMAESFSRSVIEGVVEYLIENVHKFWGKASLEQDAIYPIFLVLPDGLKISEKLLWQHLAESSERAPELVVAYVERLDRLLSGGGRESFYNDERHFVGAHAVFSVLDYLYSCDKFFERDNISVFDAFYRYLNLCDMDHEVHEDGYIIKVLSALGGFDENRYFQLLNFRLTTGQHHLSARTFADLNGFVGRRGKLKKLVDYHLKYSRKNGGSWDLEDYVYLLSAVYGGDDQRVADVLEYVGMGALDFRSGIRSNEGRWRYINRMREDCEQYRTFCSPHKGFIDSGFHKFDQEKKVWLEK